MSTEITVSTNTTLLMFLHVVGASSEKQIGVIKRSNIQYHFQGIFVATDLNKTTQEKGNADHQSIE